MKKKLMIGLAVLFTIIAIFVFRGCSEKQWMGYIELKGGKKITFDHSDILIDTTSVIINNLNSETSQTFNKKDVMIIRVERK